MRRYFEDLRAIIERHGGTVEKFVGDAVMAVFGIPVSHEDDALRAVRAASEMRAAIAEHGLEARIGVNTGEVVVGGEGETLVTGDAVNVAARLEQAAASRRNADRRRDSTSRARCGSGRGGRAARAEGEVRPRRGIPTPRGASGLRGARAAPRDTARRPRTRAAAAVARLRGCSGRPHVPAVHAARPGRDREVAPRRGLPRARGRLSRRPPWAVPLVRRGHHLLAARRDPDRGRRRARRLSSARRRRRRSSPSGGSSRRGRPNGRRSS